nr:MAG TPA: hypothetical protein [Caudoviricetes sp.]
MSDTSVVDLKCNYDVTYCYTIVTFCCKAFMLMLIVTND